MVEEWRGTGLAAAGAGEMASDPQLATGGCRDLREMQESHRLRTAATSPCAGKPLRQSGAHMWSRLCAPSPPSPAQALCQRVRV